MTLIQTVVKLNRGHRNFRVRAEMFRYSIRANRLWPPRNVNSTLYSLAPRSRRALRPERRTQQASGDAVITAKSGLTSSRRPLTHNIAPE